MKDYVNFDRQDIGQTSLVEATSCLSRIHGNKHLWKYAIISIHNALQCYLSVALRGGSGINTWKKPHAKKWLKAYDESIDSQGLKELPNVQLDYFMELYDKLFTGKPDEQRSLIYWLNETRNKFIHFNSPIATSVRGSFETKPSLRRYDPVQVRRVRVNASQPNWPPEVKMFLIMY